MRKRTLILFLITFLIGGYFSQGLVVSSVFDWYLKGYCSTCLNGELSHEGLRYENGTWVLEKPLFISSKDYEEGGHLVSSKEAAIQFEIAWLKRKIDVAVTLTEPQLDVGIGANELKLLFQGSNQTFNFFTVHSQFSIPKGSLVLKQSNEDESLLAPVHFSVDLSCKETKQGCCAIWLGRQNDNAEAKHLEIIVTEPEPSVSDITLKANSINCQEVMTALKHLWPNLMTCEVMDGEFSGDAHFTLAPHALPYGEGQLVLQNLDLHHSGLGFSCHVPELAISLSPQYIDKDSPVDLLHTVGKLSLSKTTSLHFFKDGNPYWSVEDFGGTLAFQTNDQIQLDLEGTCFHQGRIRKLNIEGQACLADRDQSSLSLEFQLKGESGSKDASVSFAARQLGEHWNFVEADIKQIGKEEFDFFQNIVSRVYPKWHQVDVTDGLLDASILFYLQETTLAEVKIENIVAKQIDLKIDPWNIALGVDEGSGACSLDFSVDAPWQNLHSDLTIEGGRLSLSGPEHAKWQLSNLNADLAIRQGVVQKSVVKATVAGLKGEIEIDGNSANEIARCDFKGNMADVAENLPDLLKNGMHTTFARDEVRITAGMTRGFSGACITGQLFIQNSQGFDETLDFGFSLEKPSFEVKEGWFKGEHLPLERFVSPFIFPDDNIHLSGMGEVLGVFDEHFATMRYDAEQISLESPDFCIEINKISDAAKTTNTRLVAIHVFDLATMASKGALPITGGTYFEKNSGLLFTDVNADCTLDGEHIHLSNVETFCNGIYFAGGIDLDWSMPGDGVFEVDIHSHEMHGRVSQVQDLLSHFDQSLLFLKMPVDGNVKFSKQGGHLQFLFFPEHYDLKSTIHGSVSDGLFSCELGDLSAQEISLNFFYDYEKKRLDFSDIQGTLLVGAPGHVEEYALGGDQICFTNYDRNQADFNLWVADKTHDVLRLVGTTESRSTGGFDDSIDVKLDRTLSHFGSVHPSSFEMILKDWSVLEAFHVELDFGLQTLLQDLQRFSRTGFLFLSRSLLKELNQIQVALGAFKADLQYDAELGGFTFDVKGSDILVDTYDVKKFLLNGKKIGSKWIIDELQLDQASFAADILKDNDVWNINFLGARVGKSLLVGLEGRYEDAHSILEAKVNLFEADLAHLDEWPTIQSMVAAYQPGGQIRANGDLRIHFDRTLPQGMQVESSMDCSLRSGRWRGLFFEDFENARLEYTSQKGFSLKGIDTALKSLKDGSHKASFYMDSFNSDFVNNEWHFDSLAFNVPANNLTWLTENLQQAFPDQLSPSLVEIIQQSKSQGEVKGNLKFESSEPYCALRLNLDEGRYRFMNRDHDVSHFVLEYDPFEMKISTQYRFERHPFWLTARSPTPSLSCGEIILSESVIDFSDVAASFPLTINWELDADNGLIVHKIEGALCGIHCNLARNLNHPVALDQMFLSGDISVDLSKAHALLPQEFADSCSLWKMGQGYTLKGQWALAKKDKPFSECLTFQGELLGQNFELRGYQFFNVSAQVGYTGNALRVADFSLVDPCGNLHIEEMMFSKRTEGDWSIAIPKMTMRDFRPGLLHCQGAPPPISGKALVIRHSELNDLQGSLADPTSYTGKGRLLFVNPPKTNLQHTIFAIPAEILTRLGLDLGLLNPVRGVIHFDVMDGKMVFTRFKDVYSKGRLSKFYLSHSGFQSNMDFDGNLHLKVRMKQYNLFFKLAELFTFTVRGTVQKPIYSLQKQPRPERQTAFRNL